MGFELEVPTQIETVRFRVWGSSTDRLGLESFSRLPRRVPSRVTATLRA